MKMEVEAGSSLLHDITKAAARLCVLVCNPFARERWYILEPLEPLNWLELLNWLETLNWFRVTQVRVQASEFKCVSNPAVED